MIPRILTGTNTPGSTTNLSPKQFSKADTQERLVLIVTMAEILHQKSNTFQDKKLSAQLAKIYKDLNQMVADF